MVARAASATGSSRVRCAGSASDRRCACPAAPWVYCRRSCAETLRVETVDFWEAKGLGGGTFDNECGIFGCLEVRWPR